jgi:ectoine hydroxylase-related dioxygenase (phytanoyl-CoA dioxygenase family)
MTVASSFEITDEHRRSYEDDGVVCLRGAIEPAWIEMIRAGVEKDMAEPGPYVEIYTKEADPGYFFNDFYMWHHIPELKRFAFEGPCAGLAGRLIGAGRITLFDDHIFVKEAGTLTPTAWHQDLPYVAVDGPFCSNWIPLFRAGEELCLEFVRGSHKWGRLFAPIDSLTDGSRHPSKVFERVPEIEASRDDYDIVFWEMEPGDVLYFHGLTLHQGRANPTADQTRRSLTHRWLSEESRFILRDPPAEFPKVPTDLKTGESFDRDPQFPPIWEHSAKAA